MNEVIAWVAPAATIIAAMMTAANLGARTTGWGFVLFTIGSLCWSAAGFVTGQTNLLATNIFLTLVNFVGIWRWLGIKRQYEDGGKAAEAASRRAASPSLFTASGVVGMLVEDERGDPVGKAVEALLECGTAKVSYVVVASGGIAGVSENLRAVPRQALSFDCEHLTLLMRREAFTALDAIEPGEWPAKVCITAL